MYMYAAVYYCIFTPHFSANWLIVVMTLLYYLMVTRYARGNNENVYMKTANNHIYILIYICKLACLLNEGKATTKQEH